VAGGLEPTATTCAAEVLLQPFWETVTVYEPAALVVMLCVVAPLLHRYLYPAGALNVTLSPGQKLSGPEAITLAGGAAETT
jgi:hypothetical protein